MNNIPMVFPSQYENVKFNEFHTLFINKEPGETIQITPDYNRYILYLTEFGENARGLHEAYQSLREAKENDILEIRINSIGGLISEGKILYNLKNELFNGRCITVLDPLGYSMGALAFCFGDERVIYETSEIMYHNYSTGTFGKGNEIISHMKHTDKSLKNFFDSVILGLSDEEKKSLYSGGDFWFDAKEMCKRKIATIVSIDGYDFKAEEYLKLLKRMNRKAKKLGIKKRIKTLAEAKKIYGIDVVSPYIKEMDEKAKQEQKEKM